MASLEARSRSAVPFDPVALFMDFFSVAMGVNDRKNQQNQPACQQDNNDRFMLPNLAKELGEV